jgi:hypothetical protein
VRRLKTWCTFRPQGVLGQTIRDRLQVTTVGVLTQAD